MNALTFAACAAVLLLPGCTDGPPDAAAAVSGADAGPDPMRVAGRVLTAALVPVEGASVTLVGRPETVRTDAQGAFDLGELPGQVHALRVSAEGFLDAFATVQPGSGAIAVLLEAAPSTEPYATAATFAGFVECALEAVFISPSCDSALTVVPRAPRLFDEGQAFGFGVGAGWRTLVLDLAFDGDAHPGLDGLRLVLRGARDAGANGTYEQFGRWHGPGAFSVRVEPGGSYPEGVEPVPGGAFGFEADVYPHSHAYQPGGAAVLGVGAAKDVRFDLHATAFHNAPAPTGWSLLGGA